ncbi:unnamed protein product [Absidia cylindrospora]
MLSMLLLEFGADDEVKTVTAGKEETGAEGKQETVTEGKGEEETVTQRKEETEEELTELVKTWASYANANNYVGGTKQLRNHFWGHGFRKRKWGDCQEIYHRLTDKGPLLELMVYSYMTGKPKKAHAIVKMDSDPSIAALFHHWDYVNSKLLSLPQFVTINDTISSTATEDQYDYPESFIIYEGRKNYTYKLHGRIIADNPAGGHFHTIMQIGEKNYKINNMDKNVNCEIAEFKDNLDGKMD